MRIEKAFKTTIENLIRDTSLPEDWACVIGVSGGADSLTLLHLCYRFRDELGLAPFVVHVNHGIRGMSAAADATFVAATCAEWNIPYRIQTVDVPALVEQYGFTIEEAARKARYTALMEAAQAHQTSIIMVAHQADDQAETILLNLVRGAGLNGLKGMETFSDLSPNHLLVDVIGEGDSLPFHIVRPLLQVNRAEVEQYCDDHNLNPRADQTNKDPVYTRNRIRHTVIPFLETINPNLTNTLNRTAEVIQAQVEYLDSQVDETWQNISSQVEEGVLVSHEMWQGLPLALQREVVKRACYAVLPSQEVGFVHIEHARQVGLASELHSIAEMGGGLTMRLTREGMLFSLTETTLPPTTIPLLPMHKFVAVKTPGHVTLPGGGWHFTLEPYDGPRRGPEWKSLIEEPWATPFDAATLRKPLFLRTREPGDRIRLYGVGGTQSVTNFMSNQKIPLPLRDRIPLLVSSGRVAWICGYRVDERFMVTDDTQSIWIGRFTSL